MKRIVEGLVNVLPVLALLGGVALVAVGAGMIYLPAGVIAGGGLLVAGAVLSVRGEDERK